MKWLWAALVLWPMSARAQPGLGVPALHLALSGVGDDDDSGDQDAPPPKKPAPHDDSTSDDANSSGNRDQSTSDDSSDDSTFPGGWGAIGGTGPSGTALLMELGLPGVRATYLRSRGGESAWTIGGGGEIDFPPLSLTKTGNPYTFNAVRLIGNCDASWSANETASVFFHFDPQWILSFGTGALSFFYLPLDGGVSFDLHKVRLIADAGIPVLFAGGFPFPFGDLDILSPFVGAGVEVPMGEDIVLTARVRVQTYFFEASVFGAVGNSQVDASVAGLGWLMVGVAYKLGD